MTLRVRKRYVYPYSSITSKFISDALISRVINVSEINYLCVHKKLRSKRLAPVLIKEVTRQCNLKGVFQAIYTGGVVIPTPVSVCRYHHRLLNIPKLVNTRFCFVPRNMTLARMIRVNKLASATTLHGLREMQEKDIVAVTQLFTEYMKRFDMVPLYDIDEIWHQFLSGMGEGDVGSGGPGRRQRQVTWAYVVEVCIHYPRHVYSLICPPGSGNWEDHRLLLFLLASFHSHR